jgi:hypothetical protein
MASDASVRRPLLLGATVLSTAASRIPLRAITGHRA